MSSRMLGILCAIALLFAGAGQPGQGAGVATGAGAPSTRLPALAVPDSYRLRLEPDLTRFSFDGDETISLEVVEPTSTIVLNAAELEIESASIAASGAGAGGKQPARITLAAADEQAQLDFVRPLAAGKYDLRIVFKGSLNDRLRGFYRSFYTDDSGARHALAATQMEPTDARRMFPCFDEPQLKATYQITAVIDPALTAISNAPVASVRQDTASHKKIVEFARTPKMSTYLVALVVGDLDSTPPTTAAGVPIRVWSVRGKARLGLYARDFASRLLPYYNSYFGVPYPAPKLDLVAIPDFEAGAMENLGAITFRESLLLVDEQASSTDTRQAAASVIAHEMAHMWFGDLVTMLWWDDIWLNEAFATWMSTKAVDYLMPEWHFWDQFGLTRSMALQTDSLASTRPIHFAVHDPGQINEMFDEITYKKGASILRMLEQFVTEEVFNDGVKKYMDTFKFANAGTEDLWRAIGRAARLPVPAMMHGWVYKPGYPLIGTDLSADGKVVSLFQRRFFLDPAVAERFKRADSRPWNVPLALKDAEAAEDKPTRAAPGPPETWQLPASLLLQAESRSIWLAKPVSAIFANSGGCGFYRVRYSSAVLRKLAALAQDKLSGPERLSLLTDQWALAVSGEIAAGDYLDLTGSYKTDSDPSVVKALIGELYKLDGLVGPPARASFEKFVRDRLGPNKEKLGWTARPNEPDLTRMLRGAVLGTLGTIGQDGEVIHEARRLFKKYLAKPDAVDPDLLSAVTRIVAYNGDGRDFQQIKQLWKEARTPEVEQRNLMALADFQRPELIGQTLALCLSDEVRTQDAGHLFGAVFGNQSAKSTAWEFMKANWSQIVKRYPLNMVPHVVSAASSLNSAAEESDLRGFFATHPVPAGKHAVARLLERVHISVNFKTRSGQAIEDWLKDNFS